MVCGCRGTRGTGLAQPPHDGGGGWQGRCAVALWFRPAAANCNRAARRNPRPRRHWTGGAAPRSAALGWQQTAKSDDRWMQIDAAALDDAKLDAQLQVVRHGSDNAALQAVRNGSEDARQQTAISTSYGAELNTAAPHNSHHGTFPQLGSARHIPWRSDALGLIYPIP